MELNIESAYLKLIDMSKYIDTYSMRNDGKPLMMYKPILCIGFHRKQFMRNYKSPAAETEYSVFEYLNQDRLKDIQKIWGTKSQMLLYLKDEQNSLQAMALTKLNLFGNQEVEVKIITPHPKMCIIRDDKYHQNMKRIREKKRNSSMML